MAEAADPKLKDKKERFMSETSNLPIVKNVIFLELPM